ncbi:hypothetical protein ABLO07_02525 [Mycobacterium tuberculosis]
MVYGTGLPHQELRADYFTTRMDPDKERSSLVAKLEAQGLVVTLEPAASNPAIHTVTNRPGFAAVAGGSRLPWSP